MARVYHAVQDKIMRVEVLSRSCKEVSSLLRKANARKGFNSRNIEMGDSQMKQGAP